MEDSWAMVDFKRYKKFLGCLGNTIKLIVIENFNNLKNAPFQL